MIKGFGDVSQEKQVHQISPIELEDKDYVAVIETGDENFPVELQVEAMGVFGQVVKGMRIRMTRAAASEFARAFGKIGEWQI